MLSRAQLVGLGLPRASVERLSVGWARLARGIYLVGADVGQRPWPALVWAGLLLGGHGARAAGLTAAALDGLAGPEEDLTGRRTGASQPVHILVPGRHIGPHEGFVFTRERPELRLPSAAREPARTRIEDTTLDLCAAGDEESVLTWLTRACQRRLTTPERLRRRAQARPTLRHRPLVLDILQDVASGATSHLEYRALHDVFRPHGLPEVEMQHRIGHRVADAVILRYRVVIEFDGRVGHVAEGAFRDLRRDNAHLLEGWVTLRFGWADVTGDPCGVARQIAQLLSALGWPEVMTRCPRCPPEWAGR